MNSVIMATAKSNSRLLGVAPGDIRFTQDTVPAYFDPPHAEDRLDKAVELILSKRLSADDFPHMRVLLVKDQLWTLNNRTLWVFRKARVAQVVVRLKGRFDDDTNPFLRSHMYKLISPQEFIPQVRGECRLDFDHPSEWSDFHRDMGVARPSEVPLNLPARNLAMAQSVPSSSSSRPALSSPQNVFKHWVRPFYQKQVFKYWYYIRIWPLQTNDTFTEKEKKRGVRLYLCDYKGCKGYFNIRRDLDLHLKGHHNTNVDRDTVKSGVPCWWQYSPLAPDSEVCMSRQDITTTALRSLPASPMKPPPFLTLSPFPPSSSVQDL